MYEYNCKLDRVIDGDTVDVDIDLGFNHWIHGERIRLFGIDGDTVDVDIDLGFNHWIHTRIENF